MKPMSSKSFHLEERIHDCWGVVNDLNTLNRAVCDKGLSDDQIANILIGMIDLYSLKFDELFECFSALHSDVCAIDKTSS